MFQTASSQGLNATYINICIIIVIIVIIYIIIIFSSSAA
jgi:hypothetical protein